VEPQRACGQKLSISLNFQGRDPLMPAGEVVTTVPVYAEWLFLPYRDVRAV
jgi:hypothetical protein